MAAPEATDASIAHRSRPTKAVSAVRRATSLAVATAATEAAIARRSTPPRPQHTDSAGGGREERPVAGGGVRSEDGGKGGAVKVGG